MYFLPIHHRVSPMVDREEKRIFKGVKVKK